MKDKVIFTIQRIGSDRKQEVKGDTWHTLEHVWASECCWYSHGSEVIITNTQTGECKKFTKE